jgi:large subunit ribosomal protein L15
VPNDCSENRQGCLKGVRYHLAAKPYRHTAKASTGFEWPGFEEDQTDGYSSQYFTSKRDDWQSWISIGSAATMNLHELGPAKGSRKRRKRIGRGPGSGHGKTSGKGHKGLLARSGGRSRQAGGFEGGQMSLIRRVPKHGFTNVFRKEYSIVNLKSLGDMIVSGTITPQALVDVGLVKRKSLPIKILGNGDLTKAIVVQAHKFSKSAEAKIRAAGGRVEVIPGV